MSIEAIDDISWKLKIKNLYSKAFGDCLEIEIFCSCIYKNKNKGDLDVCGNNVNKCFSMLLQPYRKNSSKTCHSAMDI